MPLSAILSSLPAALQLIQIAGNMIAAGRSTTTADETAQLQAAMGSLASANANFNAQFADVLPQA